MQEQGKSGEEFRDRFGPRPPCGDLKKQKNVTTGKRTRVKFHKGSRVKSRAGDKRGKRPGTEYLFKKKKQKDSIKKRGPLTQRQKGTPKKGPRRIQQKKKKTPQWGPPGINQRRLLIPQPPPFHQKNLGNDSQKGRRKGTLVRGLKNPAKEAAGWNRRSNHTVTQESQKKNPLGTKAPA